MKPDPAVRVCNLSLTVGTGDGETGGMEGGSGRDECSRLASDLNTHKAL